MQTFALTRENYFDLWTYEVQAVPVAASGLTWPPHSSAPFDLVSHLTTIFPISWAFYYTIAYHVVTVAESRETWRLKCVLISGIPDVLILRLALILDDIKCDVLPWNYDTPLILWFFFCLVQHCFASFSRTQLTKWLYTNHFFLNW